MDVRVLIVDDSLFMRNLLAGILRKAGYVIAGEAATCCEALEQVSRLAPDIVTLDLIMPDLNGLDIIESIRSASPATRIVVCSAVGQEPIIREALERGAAAYLQKPFTPEQVIETLGNLP